MSYDVLVIGAGIIGLSCAWRSAELGARVVVLDRSPRLPPRSGASWVAAGMLAPVTEAAFGETPLLALALESARRWEGFLTDLSAASERLLSFSALETLFVGLTRDQSEALGRLHEFQSSLGLEVALLSPDQARALEPFLHPSVSSAVIAAGDRAVDPREVDSALVAALENAGVELRTGVEVTELTIQAGRVAGVTTSDGSRIPGGATVLAAGAWSSSVGGVTRDVVRSLRPVKGQIVRLGAAQAAPKISRVIRTEDVYLVPRANGEIVVGATVEERGFDVSPTAGGVLGLLRSASEAVPGVLEMEILEVSAGLRPGIHDNLPLVGPATIDGLVVATGHYRHGILLAPMTADAVAQILVKGEAPPEVAFLTPRRLELQG